jgi:hypothetical protein
VPDPKALSCSQPQLHLRNCEGGHKRSPPHSGNFCAESQVAQKLGCFRVFLCKAGMSIDRFSGGKFVETWDNYDAVGMVQQIGAIPTA